jgi:glycerophosphoryl diester phosphodiesterase
MTSRAPSHPLLDLQRRRVVAHRGGAALRPENTMAAFENGVALGADALELDVHLSRDGVVVVCHDETVDRTTDGRGAIGDLASRDLATLDAGYRFGGGEGFPFRGRGLAVPLLREVLERFTLPLIIELKGRNLDLAAAAVDEVRRARALGRVCFGSFSLALLQAARACGADVVTSAGKEEIRRALTWSYLASLPPRRAYRAFQVPETHGRTRVVSRRFLRATARAGVPVHVWTVNDPGDMRRLLVWGVRALITDRPDLGVAAVREFAETHMGSE